MNTITQTMKFRQAIIEYSFKNGVTKAAIRYKVNRQYVYRWRKRYDGTLQSLSDKSRRPHHHLNQHTPEELKLIADMRKRSLKMSSNGTVFTINSSDHIHPDITARLSVHTVSITNIFMLHINFIRLMIS